METLPLVGVGIALAASLLWVARAFRGIQVSLNAPQKLSEGPVTATPPPYDDTELRSLVHTLSEAVASGITNVDRNNRRIEAVVRRARAELADSGLEHAGIEAEVGELHDIDGGGGESDGVLPLPVEVDETSAYDPPSGVPGFSVSELAAFRASRSRQA